MSVFDSFTSESTFQTATDEFTNRRWCNFLYASRCPFCASVVEKCKFTHIDTFVKMSELECDELAMPNLMTRHTRNLAREMTRMVDEKASEVLNAWRLLESMGGMDASSMGDLSPYLGLVVALRKLGWVIPEAQCQGGSKLTNAPYAKDVAAILGVASSSMHYSQHGIPAIMRETIALVFREGRAPICRVSPIKPLPDFKGMPTLEADEEDDDMPELLDALSEDENIPDDENTLLSRKERRARVFADMKKQKKQKALVVKGSNAQEWADAVC